MPRRPKTITLGAYKIPVTWHKELLKVDGNNVVEEADGDTYGCLKTIGGFHIHISNRATDKAECLLHETLHAIFQMNGSCDLTVDEEAIVRGLAFSFVELLRRNPQLADFIIKGEE